MLSPISKPPHTAAASAGPTPLHTAARAPAVPVTGEMDSLNAVTPVRIRAQAPPKQPQPDTDTQMAHLENKAAGSAVSDSPQPSKHKAVADKGSGQPKGLPPLKHKKAKHGHKAGKADTTAQPDEQASKVQQTAKHEKANEGNDAARKAAKQERREARRAAKRDRAGSLEPAASSVTADSSHSSAQAQQSGTKGIDSTTEADVQLPIITGGSPAANVAQPHVKQAPHMHSNSQAVATSTNAAATEEALAKGAANASSALKSPIRSVAGQQFHAAQQKPSLSGHKRLRQSPGPVKRSPKVPVISPSVPALFDRHAAGEALRSKGAQLGFKLAAASDDKLGQVQGSRGATSTAFYQTRKAADTDAGTHEQHKAASADLHANKPDAINARQGVQL